MLTEEQQALWNQQEQLIMAGLESHMTSLIQACETIANPLIERAIGGLDNTNNAVNSYHMTLGQARMQLKLLAEHRQRFTEAMARA